jgi:hypothetical protein
MTNRLHLATITLALACGVGMAVAQINTPGGLGDRPPGGLSPPTDTSQIQLTPEQKRAIVTAVKDTKIPPQGNRVKKSVTKG